MEATIKAFIKAVESIFKITLWDELDDIECIYDINKDEYDGFNCDAIAKTINDTINSLFKFNEFADNLVNVSMFDVHPFSHVMNISFILMVMMYLILYIIVYGNVMILIVNL